MQIGMIGLGNMGGNMSRRLMKAGHHCVVFARYGQVARSARKRRRHSCGIACRCSQEARRKAARDLADVACRPGHRRNGRTISAAFWSADDIIIDGGNSFYKDDIRRAKKLAEKGIRYVDCGTSGGVWGIERGYCMMIGGPKEAVDHLDPIFSALAPGLGDIPRTPGRQKGDPRAERGYIHAGPSGAGHFVKMVHNGIEYGLMQAYAEGFDILRNKDSSDLPEDERFTLNIAGYCRGLAARQRHLILAARSRCRRAREGSAVEGFLRLRPGFGRGPLDGRGRDRGSGSGGCDHRGAVRPLPLAAGAYLRRKDALGHALRLRRACRGSRAH